MTSCTCSPRYVKECRYPHASCDRMRDSLIRSPAVRVEALAFESNDELAASPDAESAWLEIERMTTRYVDHIVIARMRSTRDERCALIDLCARFGLPVETWGEP